jgi:hypothetical protein
VSPDLIKKKALTIAGRRLASGSLKNLRQWIATSAIAEESGTAVATSNGLNWELEQNN